MTEKNDASRGLMVNRVQSRLPFLLAIIVAGMLAGALPALGNPLDLYGLSSRGIGMGGAQTAASRDYGALFYNPGRMGFVPNSVGVHFSASFDNVKISLFDRPQGYDVPAAIYDSLPLDPNASQISSRYLPTAELPNARRNTTNDPNTFMLTGGIVHDLGLYWLRLGAAFSLPLSALAAADMSYVDEREQFFSNRLQFQLLNRSANRPTFLAGVAFRPIKWLGFGASVNVFGNVVANTKMFIPDALDQQNINLAMDVSIKYDAAIIAGIHFEPLDWFGFGFSFRDRSWFGADLTNRLQFWNFEIYKGEPITVQEFNYGFSFSPRVLSGGFRFDVSSFTIAGDVYWAMWHEFRPETDIRNEASWNDTVGARVGVEWRAVKWMDVRVGSAYRPSPVPRQSGRTSFVDNDKVDASAGFSFYLPWVEGLSIDAHVQFVALIPRTQVKDPDDADPVIDEFPDARDVKTDEYVESSAGLQTNNPGWPGYRSSGFIGTAGLGVTYRFK
jgi:hypothetical protein